MLYHPYILSVGMILFLVGAVVGYRKAKSLPSEEKSRHPYLVYPAYSLFLLAMALYYGYERGLALELAGGREAFAATGLLKPHVISISASTLLLTLTFIYGLVLRNKFFTEKISRNEIIHMALGSLGIAFYLLAVATGVAMYAKTGVL
jgi:divalent metal cation (Fe/Co/Zn/Cd) transporter